ncbi:hypothetical protein CFAM422_001098 [Trichoderma lentiforme]|uniref:Uncharacterized protein n=1 Tax=Trichoderma lentiforme TaxID=1567552 RepID=A0A9P5CHT4_9HYPO|nr:hypothetical protein CFAM422_001098 [Trichoderma lentiforme]
MSKYLKSPSMAKELSEYLESSSMANIKRLLEMEDYEKIASAIMKEAIRRNPAICTMHVVHGAAAMGDHRLREGEPMGCIIDVPRVRRHKEKEEYVSVSISSSVSLINHLGTRRTPSVAKKRIFHFSRASWSIALVCYFASSERKEISDFFDRHALLSPYFFEDTIGTLNKWVTELHLPFYQISSSKKSLGHIRSVPEADERDTIPEPKIIQLPYSDTKGTTGRKAVAKTLSRAVISFRFDGDLLDRYWTCHLIEYTPQQMDGPKEMSFDIPTQPINGALKSNPWRQRRVLELLLFDRSLREILRCTEEILNEAKSTLRAAKDTGNDGCSYENEECKIEFSYNHDRKEVLQEVEDSLSENLAKMQLWKNRQNGRGPEKPRWTLKDEYRYGGAISRLQASNNFYMEELVRCRAKILAFNSQLTREIDASRSDWEMRTTNNVRLFTYVTVVFLPTSFATGVFSMNGVPPIPVIRLVVITAVIALFLTIITLVNAKNLERMLRALTKAILGDAKVYDPVGDMSFNDDHPIQQARFDYNKPSNTASEVDSDLLKED